MHAVLFTLPEDVERLEAVLRRCSGGAALLGDGRWMPARRDSREVVRDALARRGWTVRERPERVFDRILTSTATPPSSVAAWLAPGGRVVLWHDGSAPTRWRLGVDAGRAAQPDVAAIALPAPMQGLHPEHTVVTGDPRMDCSFEPGAAARARGALGLDDERPVVLVEADTTVLRPAWADAIARLRTDVQVVVTVTGPRWLRGEDWPRALAGPGVSVVRAASGVERGHLVAAADLVIASSDLAIGEGVRRGRRTLAVHERPRVGSDFDVARVDDPERLRAAVLDRLRDGVPSPIAAPGAVDRMIELLVGRRVDAALV